MDNLTISSSTKWSSPESLGGIMVDTALSVAAEDIRIAMYVGPRFVIPSINECKCSGSVKIWKTHQKFSGIFLQCIQH